MIKHVSRLERIGVTMLVAIGLVSAALLWQRAHDLQAIQGRQAEILTSIERLTRENRTSMADRTGLHQTIDRLKKKADGTHE